MLKLTPTVTLYRSCFTGDLLGVVTHLIILGELLNMRVQKKKVIRDSRNKEEDMLLFARIPHTLRDEEVASLVKAGWHLLDRTPVPAKKRQGTGARQ